MRVIDIYPKEMYVKVEFSLSQLKKIKLALDNCEIKFDGEGTEEAQAAEYISGDFYNQVKAIIQETE